ncbi:MAG: family 43 glycosylhydrolase [Nibricoccus sp.]
MKMTGNAFNIIRRVFRGICLIVGCSALVVSLTATERKTAATANPIIRGDWSDPALIRVGDDYYSCRSSFGWQPGIPIAHSRDLIHWRYIGHAFVTHPKIPAGNTRDGIWGVDMGYNPTTKQFLIYAPCRDHSVYVFSADRPEGPYTMSFLGDNLGIDPGFFADDDGRLYLVLSHGKIHELSKDGLKIARDVCQLDRSKYRLFEGPAIFKHDGWYYLLFSDGGTLPHEPSTISTLRARKLSGPWEEDPHNPVMFSTDNGARFEAPAHGTLIQAQKGEWFLGCHAHETAFYTLGRQMLMQKIEWTADGWWRPTTGKVPTDIFEGPGLPPSDFALAQSDDFDSAKLGLQWFFTCAPDFSGKFWSLSERPGVLRIRTQGRDPGSAETLPVVFQQRVIDKAFCFETKVTFAAREGHEAAGLHMFHDPKMNFWLVSTVRDGKPVIAVGKIDSGQRTDLWSTPNPHGDTVHFKIVVDGDESATFYFGPDGQAWTKLGGSIYFGASAHHLRGQLRGNPDLGWVGKYKSRDTSGAFIREGNVWTAATFGIFAMRDGATTSKNADFEHFRVTPGQK